MTFISPFFIKVDFLTYIPAFHKIYERIDENFSVDEYRIFPSVIYIGKLFERKRESV